MLQVQALEHLRVGVGIFLAVLYAVSVTRELKRCKASRRHHYEASDVTLRGTVVPGLACLAVWISGSDTQDWRVVADIFILPWLIDGVGRRLGGSEKLTLIGSGAIAVLMGVAHVLTH